MTHLLDPLRNALKLKVSPEAEREARLSSRGRGGWSKRGSDRWSGVGKKMEISGMNIAFPDMCHCEREKLSENLSTKTRKDGRNTSSDGMRKSQTQEEIETKILLCVMFVFM
jgi:hypothetical protein